MNLNDDILIRSLNKVNPDEVFFSLAIIYKYEVVATKSFEYFEYAFKIWDIYDNFTEDEQKLILRFSLYNP